VSRGRKARLQSAGADSGAALFPLAPAMALATVAIVGIGKPQASDETDDEDEPRERTRVFAWERISIAAPGAGRKRLGRVSSIM
jgi:hypothetical protein